MTETSLPSDEALPADRRRAGRNAAVLVAPPGAGKTHARAAGAQKTSLGGSKIWCWSRAHRRACRSRPHGEHVE